MNPLNPHHSKESLTLIELLIAISLLVMLVLGFSSISLFSHYHVKNADIRMQLQNEASIVIEHMSKEISKAIGDFNQSPVNVTISGVNSVMTVWIDYSRDGKRDPYPKDRQIAYAYQGSPNYQIRYYENYSGSPTSYVVLSQKISSFAPPSVTDNYVNISITARWQPAQEPSSDNPEVVMRTKIKMPAVSTN